MDKYEYQDRLDQVLQLINQENYKDAVREADELDFRREKNAKVLTLVAKAYEKKKRYSDAEELLLQAFRNSPMGRSIVFHLSALSLKMGNIPDAEMYYNEFNKLAPSDPQRYVLQYRVCLAKNGSNDQLIHILEEYKEADFDEQWGYRLAELYALNGQDQKCIDLCNELQVWFGEGPYVIQAMKLKSQFCENTSEDMKKLEELEAKEAAIQEQTSDQVAATAEPDTYSDSPENVLLEEAVEKSIGATSSEIQETMAEEEDRGTFVEVEKIEASSEEGTKIIPEEETPQDTFTEEEIQETKLEKEEEEEATEEEEIEVTEFKHLPVNPVHLDHIWHFMVYGDDSQTNFSYAVELLREMSSIKTTIPTMMVKATGEKINKIGVMDGIDRFLGKMVLIDGAAALTDQRLREFSKVLDADDCSLLVVFLGTEEEIHGILERVPELEVPFSAVFTGKKYTEEYLFQYAKDYAERQGAKFSLRVEDFVKERAHELIAENQGDFKKDMESFIDPAIDLAEKKGALGLTELLGGKYDKDGYLVLKEKHFTK